MTRSTFTRTAGTVALAAAAVLPLGALAVLANTDRAKPSPTTVKPQGAGVVLEAKADDKGDKTGSNGHASFSIVGAVTDLYPGAQRQLTVTVTNPGNQDLKVTSLNVTVRDSDKPGCLAANVVATGFRGSLVIKKHQSVTTQLPVRMVASPSASCQGATFPLQYGGTAVKA